MPALNEAASIAQVIASLPKSLPGFSSIEVLVVDDGSTDATAEIAREAGAIVAQHRENKGVGGAFQTAAQEALRLKAAVLVSIDADGQFDPAQIPNLVAPIVAGNSDFAIGNRFQSAEKPENMPLIKFAGNHAVNSIVSKVAKTPISDASCGFRAYSREALFNLNLMGHFTYTHETIIDLAQKGYSPAQVPVKVRYFDGRVSRVAHNLSRYAFQSGKIIIRSLRDHQPFAFFASIALGVFLLGLFGGLFVGLNWLSTGSISPYKSLGFISLSLVIIAQIFLVLALLADMLGRIRTNQERLLYFSKKAHYDK
jgi:glycosyltransferase involved in cell wall biosynthesis